VYFASKRNSHETIIVAPFVPTSIVIDTLSLLGPHECEIGITDVGSSQRAVDGGLLWPADRQTPAGCDENVEPDGGRLCDE